MQAGKVRVVHRKQISTRQRFEIFKRDDFTCQYCGAHPPDATLHVDHITPVAAGGSSDDDNLVTACDKCNLGKSSVPLDVVPQSLANRAAEIAEREAQIAGYSEILEGRRWRIEEDAWRVAEELQPGASDGYSTRNFRSIKMFVERMGVHAALEAAEIAGSKFYPGPRRFKYFCGVCWNMMRQQDG